MANTIFRALSRSRTVNWGRLIQELVEKSIPHIGKKPSPLSPYILHLYHRNECINKVEEDALTIAEDEVAYKLGPEVELTKAEIEESLNDRAIPQPPLAKPAPDSKKTAVPQPWDEACPGREPHWRDTNLCSFEYMETPFKWVREELTDLQNQYFRLEHITRGVSRALDNYGPWNILQVVTMSKAGFFDYSKLTELD